MKKEKLTKVQREVMNRFERGQRLVFMPTRRMSGDAIYWVSIWNNGLVNIDEKAMYPQLRRLIWTGKISTDNRNQVLNHEDIKFDESNFSTLHMDGCIGF
jgi:hypothetical protein